MWTSLKGAEDGRYTLPDMYYDMAGWLTTLQPYGIMKQPQTIQSVSLEIKKTTKKTTKYYSQD